jgi:hypothetical protein
VHSKYFLKVLKNDLGLHPQLFAKLSHLHLDSTFAEFLFHLINSSKVPVLYDPSGIYSSALTTLVIPEHVSISASNYLSDLHIQSLGSSLVKVVSDLNDGDGRTQDSSFLKSLTE